jgi:hypothetical protein
MPLISESKVAEVGSFCSVRGGPTAKASSLVPEIRHGTRLIRLNHGRRLPSGARWSGHPNSPDELPIDFLALSWLTLTWASVGCVRRAKCVHGGRCWPGAFRVKMDEHPDPLCNNTT